MPPIKEYLVEKRWALIAIILGVIFGFGTAILCIAWNLVIFGFNIMYIVSPLLAGFIETFIASRKYGRSTGAISALLTFFLINGYGWFGPGWIFPKEPVTLSLITIIAIVLTLQAAFPTLINYILIVVVVGTLGRVVKFLVSVPSQINRKVQAIELPDQMIPTEDELFLEGLDVPLVSVHRINGGKIDKYIGLVVGEAVAEEKQSESKISNLLKLIEPISLEDMNLADARKAALSRMLDEAESMGANAVEEVLIDYVSMGGIQGSATIVTATGTALLVLDEIDDNNDKLEGPTTSHGSGEEDIMEFSEKVTINDTKAVNLDNGELNKKIKEKTVSEPIDEELSYRIQQYMAEKHSPPVKDLETSIKNKFEDFDKRYGDISMDLAKIDGEYDKCDEYAKRRVMEMYNLVNLDLSSYNVEKKVLRINKGLIGKEVIDSNLQVMGRVKDVQVNSAKKIEALILEQGGVLESLGISKNEIILPFSRISSVGDKILLK